MALLRISFRNILLLRKLVSGQQLAAAGSRRALCAWRCIRASFIVMGKRRADASSRTFFDQFPCVRVSRLRASGVIDPSRHQAVIPFPDGTNKLIGTAHTRLKHGGSWSYFICPRCAEARQKSSCK
jgi:hypothetical protein